jgi:RND family efflux transporter MFP subunit
MKPLVLGLLCLPAVLLIHACGKSEVTQVQANATPELPTVPVSKATVQDLSRDMVLTAEFVPFQEVDVMAKVAGYVKEIFVDVGDHVKQGQTLAILEVPELQDQLTETKASVEQADAEVAQARDEVQRAQSAHEIAHLSYQRLTGVVKQHPGLVAQEEIDDAHSKDLVSEAQVAAAKSHLTAALQKVSVNQAEEARVQTLLDYTRVTAPFTGVITKRFADTGSMIQAGTASQTQAMPVVRLSENGLLRLILPVPESAVPSVKVGEQVTVHVPTLNRSFPGRVARFADQLQLSTRTMDTEVDVPNPKLVLVPGMFAEVNLTTVNHPNALTVPVSAVDISATSSSDTPDKGQGSSQHGSGKVMVIRNGRVNVQPVVLGLETVGAYEILSGLNSGDLVVTSNRDTLREGEQVRPKLITMAALPGNQ